VPEALQSITQVSPSHEPMPAHAAAQLPDGAPADPPPCALPPRAAEPACPERPPCGAPPEPSGPVGLEKKFCPAGEPQATTKNPTPAISSARISDLVADKLILHS
jgi:hypothetical protein